jgi:uncharacterized SAM-binding protein YcdF (DUF218 family)
MSKALNRKSTNPAKKRKHRLGIFTWLMLLFLVPILAYLGLRAMGAYLIISSDLQASNAIVVLSGGDESRMKEALRLYDEKYARKIILTETGLKVEGFSQLHSFDMRIVLLSNGVPSGNILITERKVSSTRDEAQAVKNLMNNQQMTSAIIVTDPYHTRRAFSIFQEEFKGSGIRILIQPTLNSWYNSRTWFLNLDGWKFTLLEYLKLLADRLNIVLD